MNQDRNTTLDLLLRSDFGRLNPERAREIARQPHRDTRPSQKQAQLAREPTGE